MRKASRTILLAIDGLDYRLLTHLVRRGKLPAFAGLMKAGVYGRLKTLRPTLSGPIWTTVATGKLPAKHGISNQFCFFRDGELVQVPYWQSDELLDDPNAELYPISASFRRVKTVWQILGERGMPVCILNWWATWPAEPVNGILVSNLLTPFTVRQEGEGIVFPPHAIAELRGVFTGSRADLMSRDEILHFFPEIASDPALVDHLASTVEVNRSTLLHLRYAYLHDRLFLRLFYHLLETRPQTDFFALYLSGIDCFSHKLWGGYLFDDRRGGAPEPYRRALHRYYGYIDSHLGRMIASSANRYNLIVVSDHGFRKAKLRVSPGHHVNGPEGLFIINGPGVKQDRVIRGLSVTDITPLLLFFAGLPQASDMDGTLPATIFEQPVEPRYVPTYEPSSVAPAASSDIYLSEEDRDLVENRLRALGYL